MEEVMKMLGPWPILQLMFGLSILGGGVWMIFKGSEKTGPKMLEDKRAEWRAYEQLEHIEENSFKQVQLLAEIKDQLRANGDAIKGLASAIWNRREGV